MIAAKVPLSAVVHWYAISNDFHAVQPVIAPRYGITGVALNSMNVIAIDALHDAHMVGASVNVPIKKYDIAGGGSVDAILPLTFILKPSHTAVAKGKAWDDARFNEAALVSHPTDKAGAPLYTARKAVPTPIGFAADIADLRIGYFYH
jgi:hypothetical protein